VDHNLPTGPFEQLNAAVIEIVDHHEDFKGPLPNLKSKQIEVVGSCTTLVAEKFIKQAETLLNDDILCQFLLNTILIDTINLEPAMGKVTPKDEWVSQELAKRLNINQNFKEQMKDIFEPIFKAKNDISHLTSAQLLIRDYKEWDVSSIKYGIAAILLSLNDLTQRPDFLIAMSQLIQENNLSILIIMTGYTNNNNKFCRQLLIKTKEKQIGEKLYQHMELTQRLDLHLIELSIPDDQIWCFQQEAITISRKQVQPLLHQILTEYSSKI